MTICNIYSLIGTLYFLEYVTLYCGQADGETLVGCHYCAALLQNITLVVDAGYIYREVGLYIIFVYDKGVCFAPSGEGVVAVSVPIESVATLYTESAVVVCSECEIASALARLVGRTLC